MAKTARSRRRPTTVDRASGGLLYQRVYDLVVSIIEERDLGPGDRIPSTGELAEMAGVSVITVRRALDELAHSGKVVRHQGVGTFVAPERLVSEPARPGALLATIRSAQSEVRLDTQLLSLLVGVPNARQAAALGIDAGQPVWEVVRIRRVGTEPKVLERAVLPLSIVPALDQERLAQGASLYEYLAERYGLTDDNVEQIIEVDTATGWEREHLGVAAKESVVRIRGVSVDSTGGVFDSFEQTYRARDFAFYISGSSPKLFAPTDEAPWAIEPLGMLPGARQTPSAASR